MSLGRRVALKVLPSQRAPGRRRTWRRFRREAQAAARLHHTNIVPVFGVGEQDGMHYYAMQFIQGQGLDEVLGRRPRRLGDRPPEAGEALPPDGRSAWRTTLLDRPVQPAARPPIAGQPTRRSDSSIADLAAVALRAPRRSTTAGVARIGVQVGRGAGLRPPPGHPAPRRQAVEPAARHARDVWVDRLRPGQGRRTGRA